MNENGIMNDGIMIDELWNMTMNGHKNVSVTRTCEVL